MSTCWHKAVAHVNTWTQSILKLSSRQISVQYEIPQVIYNTRERPQSANWLPMSALKNERKELTFIFTTRWLIIIKSNIMKYDLL